MFGMALVPFINAGNNGHLGDQVRGFGMLHDGAIDTVFRFVSASVFSFSGDPQRRDLEAFMLQFPTTLAPIVGQQVTLTGANGTTVGGRIDLLIQRAETPFDLVGMAGVNECELVVKGISGGVDRGWLYDPDTDLFGSEAAAKGYKYKDKELDDGTVKLALWKAGKLKLVLQGKGATTLDYALEAGVSQGTVDLVFLGGDTGVCMTCAGFSGKDGSDGKKFLGKKCAAPVACGL